MGGGGGGGGDGSGGGGESGGGLWGGGWVAGRLIALSLTPPLGRSEQLETEPERGAGDGRGGEGEAGGVGEVGRSFGGGEEKSSGGSTAGEWRKCERLPPLRR